MNNKLGFESRPTWVEIRLDHLAHNIRVIKEHIGPSVKLLAVVKADGYGHGAVRISETVIGAGADWLGVASLNEAAELRQHRIKNPILILGATLPNYAKELIEVKVIPTLFESVLAEALARETEKRGEKCKIHIKVDTGMGRLGVNWKDAAGLIKEIVRLPGIEIEGVFSHLATADEEDKSYLQMQLDRFKEVLFQLENEGIRIPIKHLANSAAMLDSPDTWFDMVRVGIAMYGLLPAKHLAKKLDLRPVMSLKSKIVQIKGWPKGNGISYGATYRISKPTKIATIPIGYADGYSRLLGNKADVLIRGQSQQFYYGSCIH